MPILKVNNINSYSGNILNLGASTDAITLTATSLTVPSTASISLPNNSLSYANIANPVNFRNRIINGDMRIDQRNSGASVTPTGNTYTLDRWQFSITQSSKFSTQQNAGSVTPPVGFTKYLGVTSLSAYSISAGDTFRVQQAVEGYNIADLAWGTANAKTVTLSFQVYSSLTGTFGGSVYNSAGARSYPFSYSIPVANTWTTISITIAGDTTGTWATDNSAGLYVAFSIGTGSTYSTTAGAWASGFYVSATGATSVVGTNGATFYITGVQLEAGSNASGFEFLPYDVSLLRCQRYYEILVPYRLTGVTYLPNGDTRNNVSWHVKKRTSPSVSSSGTLNVIYVGNGAAGANIDMGTLTVTSSVDSVGVSSMSNYSAFSGTIMAWGDYGVGSFTFYGSAEL